MSFKLDHIHIRSDDYEASVDYYVTMFGGEVVKRFTVMDMPVTRIRIGDMHLAVSPKKKGQTIESPETELHWGVYQIGFRVEDLSGTMTELKAKGAQFTRGPVEVVPGVKAAFIKAPDGVEIELLE